MNQYRLFLISLFAIALMTSACETSTPTSSTPYAPTHSGTSVNASSPPEETPSPTHVQPTADADVLFVRAVLDEKDTWTFYVTIQHPDTGWDDYADGWDVLTPDGMVLKRNPDDPFTRLLVHPHVNEQPFTRSQSGIHVPDGVTLLRVRAHDIVDGYGGKEVVIDLTQPTGKDYQIER